MFDPNNNIYDENKKTEQDTMPEEPASHTQEDVPAEPTAEGAEKVSLVKTRTMLRKVQQNHLFLQNSPKHRQNPPKRQRIPQKAPRRILPQTKTLCAPLYGTIIMRSRSKNPRKKRKAGDASLQHA